MSVQQTSKKQDSLKKQGGFAASCALITTPAKIDFLWICMLHKFIHASPILLSYPGALCLSSSWHPCQTTAINSLIYMVIVKLATSFEDGHGSVLCCCSLTGAGSLV